MPAWPYAGTAVCGHGDGREQETRAILHTEQPDSGNFAGLAMRAPCRRRWCAAWHEDEDERGRERRGSGRYNCGAGTPRRADPGGRWACAARWSDAEEETGAGKTEGRRAGHGVAGAPRWSNRGRSLREQRAVLNNIYLYV
jgi:hypothetical protein